MFYSSIIGLQKEFRFSNLYSTLAVVFTMKRFFLPIIGALFVNAYCVNFSYSDMNRQDAPVEGSKTRGEVSPENAPIAENAQSQVADDETDSGFDVTDYRRRAEQGDSKAQRFLAFCYANGDGVKQDDAQAFKWFKLAAEQNNISAYDSLNMIYLKGQLVTKNKIKAFKMLKKLVNKMKFAVYYL